MSTQEPLAAELIRSRLALTKMKTVSGWARARGHKVKTVYHVLSGRLNGKHGGKAAEIAKQLRRLVR